MGFDDQIVIDGDLAGHAKIIGLFCQFFRFHFISRVHITFNNRDTAGSAKTTASTVQNFMNAGVNAEFIADCRFTEVFSGFDLNRAIFSFKMDF